MPARWALFSLTPTTKLPEGAITPSGWPWTTYAASKSLFVVHVVVLVPFD
jgi:hypothetical protein